ncbi:hypothetical protein E2C01_095795 [Portunus trituberculatus]|uniref:Secreted protein n=1 Tax=Portunus trituberculatus TaxID=210409 RepID=A0A5B7K563_PORTR|nr:hypothetical protein [Portunus trituberculatus]
MLFVATAIVTLVPILAFQSRSCYIARLQVLRSSRLSQSSKLTPCPCRLCSTFDRRPFPLPTLGIVPDERTRWKREKGDEGARGRKRGENGIEEKEERTRRNR